MNTPTRTTRPNPAYSLKSKPDALEAAQMYLSAKSEGDQFRLEAAGRHLELIEYFQRLNTGFDHDSTIPERGR